MGWTPLHTDKNVEDGDKGVVFICYVVNTRIFIILLFMCHMAAALIFI